MPVPLVDTPALFPSEPFELQPCSPELARLGPTPVFSAFWSFAAERQAIFWRRMSQANPPWTNDPILDTFKFTNVYRASDRVSQYLIQNVIYAGNQNIDEVAFRVLLFKLFNKIETWELLQHALGPIKTTTFSADNCDRVLTHALACGRPIYSAAYIMPSGSSTFRTERKHTAHLQVLQYMMNDGLPRKIAACRTLEGLFNLLRSYPLLGDFLAYQYAVDLNYSDAINFEESEFVVPGPGARSGIAKCFSEHKKHSDRDIIRMVTKHQEDEFRFRGIPFQWLGKRKLQLIDVQNLLCEIDKYARVRFPEAHGTTSRTRIKQRFNPNLAPIRYWYPPKWGINELFEKTA
jgi:alpha-glutamyl/putrescinyl thymine pyrophosphorylase clade 1